MNQPQTSRFSAFFLIIVGCVVASGCSSADADPAVDKTVDEDPASEEILVKSTTTARSKKQSNHKIRVFALPKSAQVPDSETDDQGVVHVAYVAQNDVYYIKSSDQAQTFSKPLRVNSEAKFASGNLHRGPDLAVGKNGRIHIAWYNDSYLQKRSKNESGVMVSHIDPGAKQFEPTRNLNQKPSDNFSISADKKGNVAVIWMAGAVFANVSQNGGKTFAPAVDTKADPCECCASRAAYTASGDLTILYRNKTDDIRDTYLAIRPQGERAFSHVKISQTPWPITFCPMTGGYLSAGKKGILAGWETKKKIYFARLDNRGRRQSSDEILVADRGQYPVALRATDDTVLLAWKNGKQIQWQLFDAQDNPIGKRGSAACSTSHRPSGVVTGDGQFVLFP